MTRLLLSMAFSAVLLGRAVAADSTTGFLDKIHKDADGSEHKFVVFVPHDYKGDKEYPVILFLHGSAETKGDKSGKMPVEVGIGTAIKKREKTFPFIVVIPQSEQRTWKADSADAQRALAMLDETCKTYKTDMHRIYLTGLSMGGSGTWSLAAKYPDKWAAIVPICGKGKPEDAEKITSLPCWSFSGDADPSIKPIREMVEALRKAGSQLKYTEYPGVGHESWDKAYDTDELYTWMLEQKKK